MSDAALEGARPGDVGVTDIKRLTDAGNGLAAALDTFVPVIREAGLDPNDLLELAGCEVRVTKAGEEPYVGCPKCGVETLVVAVCWNCGVGYEPVVLTDLKG